MSLRKAPQPRLSRRVPSYPTASALGLAVVLVSCGGSRSSGPYSQYPEPPQPERAGNLEPPVMILATDPETPPLPRPRIDPPPPPPPPAMVAIPDPQARREPAPCPGDCPSSFQVLGPSADIRFRVESGGLPDAHAVLSSVQPTLHTCATRIPRQLQVHASISIRASVARDGRMHALDVRSTGEVDSALASCIANATLSAHFRQVQREATLLVIVDVTNQ